MISYHPKSSNHKSGRTFTEGFEVMPWHNVHMIAKCMTEYAWSPIIFEKGYRRGHNFKISYWVGLDFDCSEMTLDNAVNNVFCDMIHVIGTTRNHGLAKKESPAGDRFRVLLKWQLPISCPKTYSFNMEKLIKSHDADPSGSDTARHFFPCREIVSVSAEGYCQDVELFPKDYQSELLKKKAVKRQKSGVLSFYAERKLTTTWEEGTKNTTCFALGCEFARCGVSYEDAIARILESPEYGRRKVPQTLYDEIAEAVFNGYKTEGITHGRHREYRNPGIRRKP